MDVLVSLINPFEGISKIEIFKPQIINGKLSYPVNIDSLITIFQYEQDAWIAVRLRSFITEEVSDFIDVHIRSASNFF